MTEETLVYTNVLLYSPVASLDGLVRMEEAVIPIECQYERCLVDSELPGSRSRFLSRTQDNKLHLTIDAFKFHNENRGELYITCHLNAVVANDAETTNKACSLINGRWRSADGDDYLCGSCQSHDKPTITGKFGPRGFEKTEEPEPFWSGERTNTVLEQDARVGPVIVLPAQQTSGPVPVEEFPPGLNKFSRPSLSGSQWRSGINDTIEKDSPEVDSDSKDAVVADVLSPLDDVSPTVQFTVDVTEMSNATETQNVLSHPNDS
ncbi:Zona pellucida sperm-binding protein 3 [Liparis tanakae]|uniref:Zona pellucida sperm-binding protein 3 n=1 Tax=Liparis tanakae TaxID=230148 RepID=A0A4Z2IRX9_9TELE|nr:Zona pellucida sperm-binding protein 3 [Liparis tanakae]